MNLLELKYGRDQVETPGFLTVRCYWNLSKIIAPSFNHFKNNIMTSSKKQQSKKADDLQPIVAEVVALWLRSVQVKEFNQFFRELMLCYIVHKGEELQQWEWDDYLATLQLLNSLDNLNY